MSVIQIKRGLRANVPATAAAGELVHTTDDQELSVGTGAAVVPIKIKAANVTGLINGGTQAVNAQTGTSYAVLASDAGKLVTGANAAAQAYSIASGVFTSGQFFDLRNKGAGDLTLTPASATINGQANFVLHAGQDACIVFDGTNFQVETGRQVVASTAPSNQFATGIGADGVMTYTQPAFTNISGQITGAQLPATIDGGTF
jgi:hypothetical protein